MSNKKWHQMMYNLHMKISFKLLLLKNVKILASQSQKESGELHEQGKPEAIQNVLLHSSTFQEHVCVSKLDTMPMHPSGRYCQYLCSRTTSHL